VSKVLEEGMPRLNKQMSDAGLADFKAGKKIPPP
jgi:hypothetical protein